MGRSYVGTMWENGGPPAINQKSLRNIETGLLNAHGIISAGFSSNGQVDIASVKNGAGHYIKLPVLTQAHRNQTTPVGNMVIYNATNQRVETYVSGVWAAVETLKLSSAVNMNNHRITGVGSSTSYTAAINKIQADNSIKRNAYWNTVWVDESKDWNNYNIVNLGSIQADNFGWRDDSLNVREIYHLDKQTIPEYGVVSARLLGFTVPSNYPDQCTMFIRVDGLSAPEHAGTNSVDVYVNGILKYQFTAPLAQPLEFEKQAITVKSGDVVLVNLARTYGQLPVRLLRIAVSITEEFSAIHI